MSLATSGGGLGGATGGGLVMAHRGNAMARAAQQPPQPPPGASSYGAGAGPPPSVAALGADLFDKQQRLTLKEMRSVSHLPLVAVDLYGDEKLVALFPPKSKQDPPPPPVSVGTLRSLTLKPTETSYKTLRKWLTKSKGYDAVRVDSLSSKDEEATGVTLINPHQWLGVRRLKDVPAHVRESNPVLDEGKTPAISEEASAVSGVGITITNGTLDGTSAPAGDDFDRVVYKVRLHESKKTLTVLPEEAANLLLAQAQHMVARKVKSEEEEILDFPLAVSVPAWACRDATIEALMDATIDGVGVFFQRSMAACAGALLPGPEGSSNAILARFNQVRAKKHKEFQKENPANAAFEYDALLLLIGLTQDGVECTAVQVSALQPTCPWCYYGNFKVLTNVSYQHEEPITILEKCVQEAKSNLDSIAPEADGPVAFITYGTLSQQSEIKSKLDPARLGTWKKVPMLSTERDCVALGTAVLGAVSHGRLLSLKEGDSGKSKAQLGIRIQDVAPTAVGIRMNYHAGAPNKWTPVKVLFDFDRRVPAGPYPLELKAAELAAHRNADTPLLSSEEIVESAKKYEGSKGIPKREEAALDFRLQVVQKWERTGEWMPVGDPIEPLSSPDVDDVEKRIAFESAVLELSLGPTGIVTTSQIGDGESVVQALKSARNSKLRYYIGILVAIAFFGGFLIKSYWEERVFERDTQRVLMYYKHVVPGSYQDGDERNARYLVWKYTHKKAKLWRRLEAKYGQPVLHAHEWADVEEEAGEEEVVDNLDESSSEKETKTEAEGEEPKEEAEL